MRLLQRSVSPGTRTTSHRSLTAVSAGANVKAVQRMLGHASAALTLDRYADLFGDDLDAVADRLDAVVRTARGLLADSCRHSDTAEDVSYGYRLRNTGPVGGGRYWD